MTQTTTFTANARISFRDWTIELVPTMTGSWEVHAEKHQDAPWGSLRYAEAFPVFEDAWGFAGFIIRQIRAGEHPFPPAEEL